MKHEKYYHRSMTDKKQKYKLAIIKNWDSDIYNYFKQNPSKLGQLRKGKVHCSCFICSHKTKDHGLPVKDKRQKGFVIEE